MKKYVLLILIMMSFFSASAFAQRTATNTISNFAFLPGNKYSFDIYSQRTGATSIRVGLTSFYFDYNAGSLSNPVLSNVNSKYTTGSATGDYTSMTSGISGNQLYVSISFAGLGDGTGDLLSTAPGGEMICTVTLDVVYNIGQNIGLSWNDANTGMITPLFQSVALTNVGSDNTPLPVELTSFTAVAGKSGVLINWQTASEKDNLGFEIEKKSSSTAWTKIGFVNGSGNSYSPKNYSYSDKSALYGTFSYRLKQLDINGNFKYSDAIEVETSQKPQKFDISNYPNPFNPSTVIRYELPQASQLKITVYNMIGQQVAELFNGFQQEGIYQISFDGKNLSSGTYLYTLQAGTNSVVKKMLLIK